MIVRFPDYFEKFECLGGSCKKSCCIGWELEVDPDTFDYYQSVPGEFGDRLRRELKSADEDDFCGFALPIDGRCPFLNSDNLCDIVLNIGDEALCDICSNYPRHTFTYGDICEKGLTISCEEACRLLFESERGISFKEIEIPDSDIGDDELSKEEIDLFESRQKALFELISNRDMTLDEKATKLVWEHYYPELFSKDERLRILSLLEPIDSEWVDMLSKIMNNTNEEVLPWDEIIYEKLLLYFLYRYLPRGLYDGDIDSKIRFSLFCISCIRDLENVMYSISDAASMFSREVEHSDENIETIMEELLFL